MITVKPEGKAAPVPLRTDVRTGPDENVETNGLKNEKVGNKSVGHVTSCNIILNENKR
jgi:hypothetical protein